MASFLANYKSYLYITFHPKLLMASDADVHNGLNPEIFQAHYKCTFYIPESSSSCQSWIFKYKDGKFLRTLGRTGPIVTKFVFVIELPMSLDAQISRAV